MNNETDGPKWDALCRQASLSEQDKTILTCTDRRQNGSCGCIQRYILHKTEVLNPAFVKTEVDFEPRSRLVNIKRISDDAYQLKTERNPIAGRRYSNTFADFVSRHREELTKYRLCKKAIAAVLHCSLNFLYRDNKQQRVVKRIEHFIEIPCCDKSCLRQLCQYHPKELIEWRQSLEHKDAKGEDKRKVYFDLREHHIQPCLRAIGEITSLSKATLNNLSGKTREDGIKHALQGRKRNPSSKNKTEQPTTANTSCSSVSSVNSAISITHDRERTFSTHSNSSTSASHSNRLSVIKPLEDVKPERSEEFVDVIELKAEEENNSLHPALTRARLNATIDVAEVATISNHVPTSLAHRSSPPVSTQSLSPIMVPAAIQMNNGVMSTSEPPAIPSPSNGQKRKRMPGLMPINSPISPGVRNSDSPQLEFKGELFNSDLSPDKKARPSPITPGLLTESTGFLCINTPTITPRTPRNPATPSNAAFISSSTPVINQYRQFFHYPDNNVLKPDTSHLIVKKEAHLKT